MCGWAVYDPKHCWLIGLLSPNIVQVASFLFRVPHYCFACLLGCVLWDSLFIVGSKFLCLGVNFHVSIHFFISFSPSDSVSRPM